MSKRTLLIIGGVLAALACGCVAVFGLIFGGVVLATQGPAEAAGKFMTALHADDYDKAYALCAPSLQREFGESAAGLKDFIESNDIKTTSHSISSRNIDTRRGEISGTASLSAGRKGVFSLVLEKAGEDWLVTGVEIKQTE
jgi:hypothetical protein